MFVRIAVIGALVLTTAGHAATQRLTLSSTVFRAGGGMPSTYTCDGKNVSPPLRWTAPPLAARSLALRMYDVDAGFTHWIAWGISTRSRGLRTGQQPPKQGQNDFGAMRYGGPCPPSGLHHYVFTLYALAKPPALSVGASDATFRSALKKARVLAQAKVVGTYQR